MGHEGKYITALSILTIYIALADRFGVGDKFCFSVSQLGKNAYSLPIMRGIYQPLGDGGCAQLRGSLPF